MQFYKNALHIALFQIRSRPQPRSWLEESVQVLAQWTMEKGKLGSMGKYARKVGTDWTLTPTGVRALNRWNKETKLIAEVMGK